MLGNKKYRTEFGMHMFGSFTAMLQQDDLPRLDSSGFNENAPCHIYMIARRARIAIDPRSVQFEKHFVTGKFLIQDGTNFMSRDFKVRNLLGTSELKFVSEFPHTEYFIYDYSDNLVTSGKAGCLFQVLPQEQQDIPLEILYIGQSYGVDGARSAPQRLQNHSTLQNIYAEAIKRTPDKEIWLILWAFTPLEATAIDGESDKFTTSESENEKHINTFFQNPITEQQLINFTEAALIKYFQPEYNEIFKNSFPNPAHKTYSECYKLDLHSVSVELQTEAINCMLFSPKISPSWIHFIHFNLHNAKERKSLLDFSA